MPDHLRASWSLAIDFGTTTTVAAIDDGKTTRLADFGASTRMPSGVFVEPGPSLVAGVVAANRGGADQARYVRTPKRNIGDTHVVVGGQEIPVVDLIAAVLGAAAGQAIRQAGKGRPSRIVLTHPALWGKAERDVLTAAANAAGLGDVDLVLEPVAAGYETDLGGDPGSLIAVYDLGGGTFDAAVLRRGDDRRSWAAVGAPGGLDQVGGESFDAAINQHLLGRVRESNPETADSLEHPSTPGQRGLARTWWRDLRAMKEDLSETASGRIAVPGTDQAVLLTREELEELVASDVERTVDELDRTIRRAVGEGAVSLIVLSGDTSKMPLVDRLVGARFSGVEVRAADDPKGIVARGATKASAIAAPTAWSPPDVPVTDGAEHPSEDKTVITDAIGDTVVMRTSKPWREWAIVAVGLTLTFLLGAIAWVGNRDSNGGDGTTTTPSTTTSSTTTDTTTSSTTTDTTTSSTTTSSTTTSSTTTSSTTTDATVSGASIEGLIVAFNVDREGCTIVPEVFVRMTCDEGGGVTVVWDGWSTEADIDGWFAENSESFNSSWRRSPAGATQGRYQEYHDGTAWHIRAEHADELYTFSAYGPNDEDVENAFVKRLGDVNADEVADSRAAINGLWTAATTLDCSYNADTFLEDGPLLSIDCFGQGDHASSKVWYRHLDGTAQEKIDLNRNRDGGVEVDGPWSREDVAIGDFLGWTGLSEEGNRYYIVWNHYDEPDLVGVVEAPDEASANQFWSEVASKSAG